MVRKEKGNWLLKIQERINDFKLIFNGHTETFGPQ